jgi:uncharacterized protein (UPF0305 family)
VRTAPLCGTRERVYLAGNMAEAHKKVVVKIKVLWRLRQKFRRICMGKSEELEQGTPERFTPHICPNSEITKMITRILLIFREAFWVQLEILHPHGRPFTGSKKNVKNTGHTRVEHKRIV